MNYVESLDHKSQMYAIDKILNILFSGILN